MNAEVSDSVDGASTLDDASKDDRENNLVQRDLHGEVVQDNGSRMIERESYERVIAGFRLAAEACAHLCAIEPQNQAFWRGLKMKFDQLRRASVQQAGIEDYRATRETADVRDPMRWRDARDRLYESLKQVEGGLRQLAICHRGDLVMVRMAHTVEAMTVKLRQRSARRGPSVLPSGLILPGRFG